MRPDTATQRPPGEILGRPEGGPGETRPCVSPGRAALAKREVIATLHQLIETLTALEDEPRGNDASGLGQSLPLLLSGAEAGKLLSISRAKVLDMAAGGQLPSIRVGGSVRIPRDRLMEWIEDNCVDRKARISGRPEWAHARAQH
jgi:excisionase family DNA binding protein